MSIKIQNQNTVGNYSNFNIDTLKLLVAKDDVQRVVADLRKNAGIDAGGFREEMDFQNWYNGFLEKSFNRPLKSIEAISSTPYFKLVDGIKNILKKNGLTEDFYDSLEHYIRFNQVAMHLAGNYSVSWKPKLEEDETLMVTTKIYRKLSDKELNKIKETTKFLQSTYLPPRRQLLTNPIKDVDKRIKAFLMMQKKGVHKEKIYNSIYLEMMRKKYDEGKITQEELLEAERLHKDRIEIKKSKMTSKIVAKKLYGTSKASSRVRTIVKRTKQTMGERFKKV